MKCITGSRAGLPYKVEISYGSSDIPELDQKYISRVVCWVNDHPVHNSEIMGNYLVRPKPIKEEFIMRSVEEYIDRLQA